MRLVDQTLGVIHSIIRITLFVGSEGSSPPSEPHRKPSLYATYSSADLMYEIIIVVGSGYS